jgi:hypothetical protein
VEGTEGNVTGVMECKALRRFPMTIGPMGGDELEILRPYAVECDPLLTVRVWARDEQDAKQRVCDQLANDDFSDVTTCSEISSNVQDVRLDPYRQTEVD